MGSIKNNSTILLKSSKLDQPVNKRVLKETMKGTLSSKNHGRSWLFAIGNEGQLYDSMTSPPATTECRKSNSYRSRKQYEHKVTGESYTQV